MYMEGICFTVNKRLVVKKCGEISNSDNLSFKCLMKHSLKLLLSLLEIFKSLQ